MLTRIANGFHFVPMVVVSLSMNAAPDALAADSVTFVRAAPAKGDVASQTVATRLSMDVSVMQGQQVVHEDSTRVDRAQERTVRLTHVEPGVRMAGEVTYRRAEETIAGDGNPGELAQQPVVGKTYRVERLHGELSIFDERGEVPPQAEFQIVWHNMESFGKHNPLSEFLAGQTVAIGQTLELPTVAAMALLAFGEDVVAVEQFSLTLAEVREVDGRKRAVFDAFVSSRSHGRNQMGMQVEGKLVVDAATCRVVSLDLAGPVGLTETQSNGIDTFLVSGRGKIEVAMRGAFQ
jgi:hypothetical protein